MTLFDLTLSTSQIVSLFLVPLSVAGFLMLRNVTLVKKNPALAKSRSF